ncbi:unnamed protein product, partial [marine sediment metagenome]
MRKIKVKSKRVLTYLYAVFIACMVFSAIDLMPSPILSDTVSVNPSINDLQGKLDNLTVNNSVLKAYISRLEHDLSNITPCPIIVCPECPVCPVCPDYDCPVNLEYVYLTEYVDVHIPTVEYVFVEVDSTLTEYVYQNTTEFIYQNTTEYIYQNVTVYKENATLDNMYVLLAYI